MKIARQCVNVDSPQMRKIIHYPRVADVSMERVDKHTHERILLMNDWNNAYKRQTSNGQTLKQCHFDRYVWPHTVGVNCILRVVINSWIRDDEAVQSCCYGKAHNVIDKRAKCAAQCIRTQAAAEHVRLGVVRLVNRLSSVWLNDCFLLIQCNCLQSPRGNFIDRHWRVALFLFRPIQ